MIEMVWEEEEVEEGRRIGYLFFLFSSSPGPLQL